MRLPTEDSEPCGCHAYRWPRRKAKDGEIPRLMVSFCPLHEAATDLLSALKTVIMDIDTHGKESLALWCAGHPHLRAAREVLERVKEAKGGTT